MYSIILYLAKLLYQFLYKRYYISLFLVLLIILIMIIWVVLYRYLWFSNNFVHVPYFKQNILSPKRVIFTNDIDNIHLNLLKQYLYVNKSMEEINVYNCTVLSSSNLRNIFIEYGSNVNYSDIVMLTQQYPIIKYLHVGQTLSWLTTSKKHLQCLVCDIYPQETRVYHRISTGYIENIIRISYQSINNVSSYKILFIGKLIGTFVDSVRALGLEESHIMDIINAFQCQLNFRKLHQGDRFSILVSRIKQHDCSRRSELIGARLYSGNKNYYVFSANNGKLYDLEAIRLGSDFMRFPTLKPFRISSNFNLHRLNPVTRQISPHSGVDFAVPVGTPVLSVGDGEVIISAYSKIAGNYIVIKHNGHYITRYMHLKKILVKPGQKVKRGDNIALSGNTGRSTGPHLHFEIWHNHRPINPLTSNILNVEKLLGNERTVYFNKISKVIPQLQFD